MYPIWISWLLRFFWSEKNGGDWCLLIADNSLETSSLKSLRSQLLDGQGIGLRTNECFYLWFLRWRREGPSSMISCFALKRHAPWILTLQNSFQVTSVSFRGLGLGYNYKLVQSFKAGKKAWSQSKERLEHGCIIIVIIIIITRSV